MSIQSPVTIRPLFRLLAAVLALVCIPAGILMSGPGAWHFLQQQDVAWTALFFATGLINIGLGMLFAFAAKTGRSPDWLEAATSSRASAEPPSQQQRSRPASHPQPPVVEQFLARALAKERVWTLTSNTGPLTFRSGTPEKLRVLPFWSDPRLAEQWAESECADCEPVGVSLDAFTHEWLSPMLDDGLLVGIDWHPGSKRLEGDPLALRNELERRRSSAA